MSAYCERNKKAWQLSRASENDCTEKVLVRIPGQMVPGCTEPLMAMTRALGYTGASWHSHLGLGESSAKK